MLLKNIFVLQVAHIPVRAPPLGNKGLVLEVSSHPSKFLWNHLWELWQEFPVEAQEPVPKVLLKYSAIRTEYRQVRMLLPLEQKSLHTQL